MCVAVPIGLFSGIYFAEYASVNVRKFGKPIIEILAGVPTVVYGFFAALTVGPFFRVLGESIGLEVSSESALAAGLVMGVMIIPFVSSLTDDVVNAVPQSLRDGSYAVGATKSETIKKVVFPAALPGIVGSILLAVSRAIGETMIVVMAAGLAANLNNQSIRINNNSYHPNCYDFGGRPRIYKCKNASSICIRFNIICSNINFKLYRFACC